MAPSTPTPGQPPAHDAAAAAALVSAPDTLAHSALITGCTVWAKRVEEPDMRKAEVRAIRPRTVRRSRFAQAPPTDVDMLAEEDKLQFYLHWVGYNKRLDEWVDGSRVSMQHEVVWPAAGQTGSGNASANGAATPKTKTQQKAPSGTATPSTRASTPSRRKGHSTATEGKLRKAAMKAAATKSASLKRKAESSVASPADGGSVDGEGDSDPGDGAAIIQVEMVDGDDDGEGEDDIDPDIVDPNARVRPTASFSKEDEIEKLRTSGSMTQSHNEISRVKNVDRLQIGKHEVEAWYFSPYPIEYAHIPVLYICEFCLSFYGSEKQLERHRTKCILYHPPGNEIYRHDDIHFFEIDGRRQKKWCRNLCLLCKCFLDHKTLYYDVDPFLFYVMCQRDEKGLHMVGYFSKEKESSENYNLACILTLPQYQRLGYGKLLIEFSYELSKKENKLGSPEKPLSDLGLLSYRAYWEETIVEVILNTVRDHEDVSIDEIAQKTAILHSDVMHVCQALQMLKVSKNQHVIVLSDAITKRHERTQAKKRRRIAAEKLIWKPPVFTRSQLQFGF